MLPAKANRVGYWRLLIPLPRYRRNPIIHRNALVDLHSHRQLLILLDIAEVQACQGGYAGHPLEAIKDETLPEMGEKGLIFAFWHFLFCGLTVVGVGTMLAQEVFVLDALRCGGGLGIDGFRQYEIGRASCRERV